MARDDPERNRKTEREAEREAEINEELERIGRDPDEVDDGGGDLGKQNAPRIDENEAEEVEDVEEDEEVEDVEEAEVAEEDEAGIDDRQ